MKYLVIVLILALEASAVSAASVFLHTEAARLPTAEAHVSLPWMLIACIGMVLTIALRCSAGGRKL